MTDTQAVIDAFPRAEEPWDLRVAVARAVGRPDLELSALEASTARWPSNARAWRELSVLLDRRGHFARAERAREQVRRLQPSLLGTAGER